MQILKAANYTNIIATASPYRFDDIRSIGATAVFNYRDVDVVDQIKAHLGREKLLNCFDAITTPESLRPIVKLVSPGGGVA